MRSGALYPLGGRIVMPGQFLQAGNDLITRKNMELPKEQREPLIGTRHHRRGP